MDSYIKFLFKEEKGKEIHKKVVPLVVGPLGGAEGRTP